MTRAKQQFVKTKNETIATAKSATDTAAGAAAGTSFVLVLALLVGAGSRRFRRDRGDPPPAALSARGGPAYRARRTVSYEERRSS